MSDGSRPSSTVKSELYASAVMLIFLEVDESLDFSWQDLCGHFSRAAEAIPAVYWLLWYLFLPSVQDLPGDDGKLEWIILRLSTVPVNRGNNLLDMCRSCVYFGHKWGHFAACDGVSDLQSFFLASPPGNVILRKVTKTRNIAVTFEASSAVSFPILLRPSKLVSSIVIHVFI